jgi:hypothetical protein
MPQTSTKYLLLSMLSHSKGILQLTWFSFSNYIDFIDYFRHLSEHIPKLSVLPVKVSINILPKSLKISDVVFTPTDRYVHLKKEYSFL